MKPDSCVASSAACAEAKRTAVTKKQTAAFVR
jgi:hypothetical protein